MQTDRRTYTHTQSDIDTDRKKTNTGRQTNTKSQTLIRRHTHRQNASFKFKSALKQNKRRLYPEIAQHMFIMRQVLQLTTFTFTSHS